MRRSQEKYKRLTNNSKIAVIGGGPSGSFFSYFALRNAYLYGLEVEIDIFESKNFNCSGPAGCNHCGGIVSESLIEMFKDEGIKLPNEIVRNKIETYTLHLEQGDIRIKAPLSRQKIVSMFRGLGPKGCMEQGYYSFDQYLLELAKQQRAKIFFERVESLNRLTNGIRLKTSSGFEKNYDLVVGATGLNKKAFDLFHSICPEFIAPTTRKSYISEFNLGEDVINECFGTSMHVFLLNIPNIRFGALIPKKRYVTLVLLGDDINMESINRFVGSAAVRSCFPPDIDLNEVNACQCYPLINVGGAKLAYDDRFVLIGDSSTSKLYKNGIGAAYITAKAAANTVIYHGISREQFGKYYNPVCKTLKKDNKVGHFIFMITKYIQSSSILKTAFLRILSREQRRKKEKRRMSGMFWDTFTGSAPYKDILHRFIQPKILILLLLNSFISIFSKKIINTPRKHPLKSRTVLSDVKYFFLNKPPVKTKIMLDNEDEKKVYRERIFRRLGVKVHDFKMLNIHRIGINVPTSFLMDELLLWNGDSSCWPNHIARVNLQDDNLEKIKIYLFGRKKPWFKTKLFHLFDLNAIRFQTTKSAKDSDDARYLLYECKGGYPIGVFSMFLRPSIPERGEKEVSQLFIMVGFDFYGKEFLSNVKLLQNIWAFFHDRITSNVAFRFKTYCEWKYKKG